MKRGSIFETDGIPRIQEALPLALQHVVAMIVGCVTPAIIVAGAAGLENKDQVILIQAALVVAALSTLLQLFPIGKKYRIGSGLPIIMGGSFAYVPSMQAIADGYGIDTILGAQIVGGVVAVIMGIMVKKIRVFFPPLITGTVVFTIGLLLLLAHKVNMFLVLFLCHWSLIGLSKTYFFQIPEDFLLASATIPGLYLFFREYFLNNLHADTKPKAKYINWLLITVCIGLAILLTTTMFLELVPKN